jgi:hypothetical protein
MADSVQVAVRLRPFIHAYEIDPKTREPHKHVTKVITIEQPTTIIRDPNSGKETQFTYDYSYDSFDPSSKSFASQETVWNDIGVNVLDRAWEGYNVTLFAYGQTGSGKSYSMTGGSGDDEGIMPRASREIFKRIEANEDTELTYRVEVSMCEVYMEKIHDLFQPNAGGKAGLRVREHPKMGVYVEGLNAKLVKEYDDIANWMEIGIGNRTKAATEMNADSSRAHTVLEVILTQQRLKKGSKKAQVKRSKINLVDLAGSERLGRTGAKGNTMKQGIAINQSLTNLGTVIMTLAKNSELDKPKPVPYRNSKLTHLLKNSLGGNSKTIMIAAIAPSNANYAETLGTLRYASRAKQIKNKAIVNQDESTKLINGLKAEIEALKAQLLGGTAAQGVGAAGGKQGQSDWEREREELMARLKESETLAQQAAMTWEEKSKITDDAAHDAGLGDMSAKRERMKTTACLTNLSEDPQMNGRIIHFVDEGETSFGRGDADPMPDIVLKGLSISKIHCVVNNVGMTQFVLFNPDGSKTHVNGKPVQKGKTVILSPDDRIIFGSSNVFRLYVPGKSRSTTTTGAHTARGTESKVSSSATKTETKTAETKSCDDEAVEISWHYAMEELNEAQMAAFKEEHSAEREASEKLRQQMEERLREMEAQIRHERASGGARAAELEAQLSQERSRAERLQRRKEKEAEMRSLMDQKLLKTIGLVEEANSIAIELSKGMSFTIKLRVNQSQAVREATEDDFVAEKEIYIKVDYDQQGIPSGMWHYDTKFINRLYTMRELYNDYVAAGRDLSAINNSDGSALDRQDDPFFDEAVDVSIGKALIYLEPLNYLMDIQERTSIYDFKGKSMGDLLVEVGLFADQGCKITLLDALKETPEELVELNGQQVYVRVGVMRAQGLPHDLSRDVFVSFGFWPVGNEPIKSGKFEKTTINPELKFYHTFPVEISAQLVAHIEASALEIDVLGSGVRAVVEEGGDQGTASSTNCNGSNSIHQIKANERISALEQELEMYKERERVLQDMLAKDPKAQKTAEKLMKKNGVEQSSVCSMF